jgi:Tfp pilus assembly protein FimT
MRGLGERRNLNDSKGVTIIELAIVVAIIAIMGLFMTPGLGEWVQNFRLKQAARNMASDFQFAKLKAISISSQRYCTIVFNQGGNAYVIFPDYDNDLVLDNVNIGDLDGDGDQENETTDIFKTASLERNVAFDTSQGGNGGITFANNAIGQASVGFDSRGLPRDIQGNFQNGTVFMINTNNNRARRVNVTAAGAISIAEY